MFAAFALNLDVFVCVLLCMCWKKCVDACDVCVCVTDVRFLGFFFAFLVVLVSVHGHSLHGQLWPIGN